MREKTKHPELDPQTYGFAQADMDQPIFIDNMLGLQIATMRQIIDIVKRTYCGTFATYMHISDPEQSAWLKERIEGFDKEITFTREGRKAILNKMVEAEGFEKFLHVKYMGTCALVWIAAKALYRRLSRCQTRRRAPGQRDYHRYVAAACRCCRDAETLPRHL